MTASATFVDTGNWLALANTRDAYHTRALYLASAVQGHLVTTDAVLIEVGNAFSRLRFRHTGITVLQEARTDPRLEVVPLSPGLMAQATALYISRRDKEWGLTDCISFVVMEQRGIREALAADHHFTQAGFRALLLKQQAAEKDTSARGDHGQSVSG